MSWTAQFVETLKDELGPAQLRLLQAVVDVAPEPGADASSLIADKGKVLARLRESEGAELAADALRRRIKVINDAARDKAKTTGAEPITLSTRKTQIILDYSGQTAASARRDATLAAAQKSTFADTNVDSTALQEPRVMVPRHTVFVSHGHENGEAEQVLDRFVDMLRQKLAHLPHQWRGRFSVDIWFDRSDMHGRSENFDVQTDPKCLASSFALFILNDKWFNSAHCQGEARHFTSRGTPEARPYLRIQLSGNRADGDPKFVSGPCYPEQWKPEFGKLLDLWSGLRADAADRDEFVTHIRDEICKALADMSPPQAPPPDPQPATTLDRLRRAAVDRDHHDAVVQSGQTQEPRAVAQEGEDESEPILPILTAWACDNEAPNRLFALLGSFGAGKTTTAQLFARALDERRAGDPATPFPLYLDFRRLVSLFDGGRTPSLAEMITHTLNRAEIGGLDGGELLDILRKEPCVIIFDGLDEIGTRLGSTRASQLFRDFLEIVPKDAWSRDSKARKADWSACPARLFVTCRTHFFRDALAQEGILRGHYRQSVGPSLLRTLYMAPFTLEQIKDFFQNYLGDRDEGAKVFEDIAALPDVLELVRQPIMTRFIAELAPDIGEEVAAARPVNVATIYHLLFRRTVERDSDKRPLMQVSDRRRLLTDLAGELWTRRTGSMQVDELEGWFDRYLRTQPGLTNILAGGFEARDLLQLELRNANLLIREGEEAFRFVHTSFYEYFLAVKLLELLRGGALATFDELPPVSRECWMFVVAEAERQRALPELIAAADRLLASEAPAALRAGCLRLRTAAEERRHVWPLPDGANLSDLALRSSNWQGRPGDPLRFHHVSFAGSELFAASFTDADFEDCDFTGSILSEARFERCNFTNSTGAPFAAASSRHCDSVADERSRDCLLAPTPFRFSSGLALPENKNVPGHTLWTPAVSGHASTLTAAAFSPDGNRIVTASYDTTARIWDALSGKLIATCLGHAGSVTAAAAFSPDGKRIVTASGDGTARIWDATSGKLIATCYGHAGPVNAAVFSPDGKRIVSASQDNTARVWEAASGKTIATCHGHEDWVTAAAFSPDNKRIVTASLDNTARIWDARSGTLIATCHGHEDWVRAAVFSPDGNRILTASLDTTACIWDVSSGKLTATYQGHKGSVYAAAFSPDGKRLVTGSSDTTARIWDATSGNLIAICEGHRGDVTAAAFSSDGKRIMTASGDSVARIWDAPSGKLIATCQGHERSINAAAFSSDGKRLVTASDDKTARIWDAISGKLIATCQGQERWGTTAAFSLDGKRLVTASDDKTARIWDASSGMLVATCEGHVNPVSAAAFSPDGNRIVTASDDTTVRVWDASSGTLIATCEGHEAAVNTAVFSPDGKRILTASWDTTARLWDATSGMLTAACEGHKSWINAAAFSPDGKYIVTASFDKTARVWDASSGTIIATCEGHKDSVNDAAFSPDGRRIVTASDDSTARVWDAASGKLVATCEGHEGEVNAAAFSPNGKRIVTASADSTARVWDATSGTLIATCDGHGGPVRIVTFSPDGERIVTASDDSTARIWDARSGRLIATCLGHEAGVSVAAFSPDGKRILTASDDSTARIWDAESGELLTGVTAWTDAWACFDSTGNIAAGGGELWKRLHAVEILPDGSRQIARPPVEAIIAAGNALTG